MLPLSFQVQAATDFVKRGAARMAAIEFPSYEDNETSFADLQTRVEKTMIFLASVPEENGVDLGKLDYLGAIAEG